MATCYDALSTRPFLYLAWTNTNSRQGATTLMDLEYEGVTMDRIIERFLRYIAVDTKSSEEAEGTPSTPGQLTLAKMLRDELLAMGAEDVVLDEHAYVYAKVAATTEKGKKAAKIGFLAHLDTSPALDGKCEHPQFVDYKDGDITLGHGFVMREKEFPALAKYQGKRLIMTDGSTLLGADDKAGVAAAMELAQNLLEQSDIEHGDVFFAFCPDEEIGHGASLLDLQRFAADYAFTIDGGAVGELEYETFNAASAKISIQGKSVHPGSAKNIMLNAADLACAFHALLPEAEKPQYTEGYEGFYMLERLEGNCDHASLHYIIRHHQRDKFEGMKAFMQKAVDFFNAKYGEIMTLEIKDSYYNMREKIEAHMEIVDDLIAAMRSCAIEPIIAPVRGGTDGSQLSWRGLPCPNFFTGGENFHGRYEFIPEDALGKTRDVALALVRRTVDKLD